MRAREMEGERRTHASGEQVVFLMATCAYTERAIACNDKIQMVDGWMWREIESTIVLFLINFLNHKKGYKCDARVPAFHSDSPFLYT